MMKTLGKSGSALFIFGTRPEALKLFPVIQALEGRGRVRPVICVTAQHRRLLDSALKHFGICPDHDLNVMQDGQSLFQVTSRILDRIEPVLNAARPDIILVQGDTTSTMVGALAAFYRRIPLGHVEAGLRSEDKFRPFPEEINRRLTSSLADLHFCPHRGDRAHLLREGFSPENIFVTGNTGIDALLWTVRRLDNTGKRSKIEDDLKKRFGLVLRPHRILLATVHRRESFGFPMERIFTAFRALIRKYPDTQILYPVHPNPEVKGAACRLLHGEPRIHLLPPLDYASFVVLMQNAHLILTDSGGIQEEAPSLGKPVVVLRDKTERTAGIQVGNAVLAGTDTERIVFEVSRILDDESIHRSMAGAGNPYGDGRAGPRIAEILKSVLKADGGEST